jgi:GT2 family glycosyltransferase
MPHHDLWTPSVAIIVLTWNGRDLTLDCLSSLIRLDYANYHVIVVDNGSRDDTVGAIRQKYPAVTVIENGENLGFAEGNNVGIRRALACGFDYVLLLNNDTVVDHQMLRTLVGVADSDARIGIVGPLIYYHDDPEVVWSAGNAIDWRTATLRRLYTDTRDSHPQLPYEADYVTGCALCIKREAVERIGLLDSRYFIYFEETDWCLRARAHGYKVVVVPRAHMWHKVSATMRQDSPATTYYMTRNSFLFLARNVHAARRVSLIARTFLQHVRVLIAYTLKPRHRPQRRNRDARFLALRDALRGRWGRMPADVAGVCFAGK